jgi:serine/threonine protein phosphatase 1
MRTLAVGDIHGASAALDALLAVVNPTPADLLVFLGDYVDRGPDSKGVLDRLLALQQTHRVVCLRGNHELMMARARHDRGELRMWLSVGGAEALSSYSGPRWANWTDAVPPEHWRFLEEGLYDFFETPTHIFVHANLYPDQVLEDQPEMMLFWEFLSAPVRHVSGKVMVCGHSTQRGGVPKAWPTTVCIDTGAYHPGGWLTCLDVGAGKYWQANQRGETRTGHLQEEAD